MIKFDSIQIEKVKEEGNIAKFEIGPVPKGYGVILGNSLRRVLLSSLEGYAISSVRINDVDHEFSTIPGIKENVLDIVLRLKGVKFRSNMNNEFIVTLIKKGVGEVKASDLKLPPGTSVVNGDYTIATISDKSTEFMLEAFVEKGIGYKEADQSLRDEVGRIPLDAYFSPVEAVAFESLPSRKGSNSNYDKVVITIETNGSISPEVALSSALGILTQFYTSVSALVTPASGSSVSVDQDVEDLEISSRLKIKLIQAGYLTLMDLARATKAEIQSISGVGAKAIKDLEEILNKNNLSFAQ